MIWYQLIYVKYIQSFYFRRTKRLKLISPKFPRNEPISHGFQFSTVLASSAPHSHLACSVFLSSSHSRFLDLTCGIRHIKKGKNIYQYDKHQNRKNKAKENAQRGTWWPNLYTIKVIYTKHLYKSFIQNRGNSELKSNQKFKI